MRIFAKIRQVYDRLCERKEAGADRMRQEREHLSERGISPPTACWPMKPQIREGSAC